MSETRSAGGIAEGTIRPCRFVKVGTDEGALLEADAGEKTIGVSFRETRRSDYVDSSGDLAHTDEPLSYYTDGARCWLEVVATTTAGTFLKSDGDGKGTPVTTDKDCYGARALADGSAGEIIPVEVLSGYFAV